MELDSQRKKSLSLLRMHFSPQMKTEWVFRQISSCLKIINQLNLLTTKRSQFQFNNCLKMKKRERIIQPTLAEQTLRVLKLKVELKVVETNQSVPKRSKQLETYILKMKLFQILIQKTINLKRVLVQMSFQRQRRENRKCPKDRCLAQNRLLDSKTIKNQNLK